MPLNVFFDDWTGLLRVVLVGTAAYGALIVMLRATGKRTLSKMNAFDLIVTVALGSTLATVLLSQDVALLEGVAALALLTFLQFAVTWASVRWPAVEHLVKGEPSLLVHRGAFLPDALRRERVTREEVLAALRSEGRGGIEGVEAVVLETDGSLSVVGGPGDGPGVDGPGVDGPGAALAVIGGMPEPGGTRTERAAAS